jgi:two-component system, OmpR family, sensor histidine kinase ChvG
MRLAGQLLAVSLVTLLLPWAGCQYAREVETALRDGEAQALLSTVRLLAAALGPAAVDFAADPDRWAPGRGRAADIYLHPLPAVPTLDGFVEDWGPAAELVETVGGLELVAGRRGAFLHVFVVTPGSRPPAALHLSGRDVVLEFPLEAPGAVTGVVGGQPADPRARGYWQATSRGWQIEARVPLALLEGRAGLRMTELDGSPRATTFSDSPGWLIGPDPEAQAAIDEFAPPSVRVRLADRAGFLLASRGPGPPQGREDAESWLDRLYRVVLGPRIEADAPPAARAAQLSGRHIELAALGVADVRRYAAPGGGGLLAAAAPVGLPQSPAAIVVLERDTAEILTLTRAPTRRLLAASLLASAVAAGVLLAFAALLSWRIRRLRDAAGAAVGGRGEVAGALPGAAAGDELGDLARSFNRLLGRVRAHNLYLQSLGGRLAHELRTPLAVVRSSLDNLEAEGANHGPWLGRARDGIDRMNSLVSALSAAQRIERAVASAERERFDLAAQLGEMAAAYQALHPGRPFALECAAGPCRMEGSPELIAQLLDKLVENAVDLAPPGAPIRLVLSDAGNQWRLSVANSGSRLPAGPPERLFDSGVSDRPDGPGTHLGLGLYIVRLVAEHHGGRVSARELPDDGGVEFAVELPKAPDAAPR